MIAFVQCSAAKANKACPAKNLYASYSFNLSRVLCERENWKWYILSSKYGVVHPDQIIQPYDLTLVRAPARIVHDYSDKVRLQLPTLVDNRVHVSCMLLVTYYYYKYLINDFKRHFSEVYIPFKHMPPGRRVKWLKEQ